MALLRRQVSQKLRDRPGNMRVLLKLSDLLLRASLAEERLAPSGDAEMERKLHEVSRDLLRNFGGVEADD